jgi:hypothetical protein
MLNKLGNFLDDALKRSGSKTSVDAHIIVENAGPIILQIIPELRPGNFRIEYFKGGCLTIGVVSPVVGQELKIRQEVILEALRDTFYGHRFEKLRIIPLVEKDEEYG